MNRIFFVALFVLLGACSSVPPTNVHQPMSARPAPRMEMAGANGAIFQAGAARPLFEDRRARYVGDTITVRITESTTASKKSNNKLDRSSNNTAAVTALGGLTAASLPALNFATTSESAFEGKGDASNNNAFNGSITVTVIDVMPNGNLLVSGEKQLAIGHEQEYVRLSGVVNPNFVDASNSVDSSKVADARMEYKSSGQVSDSLVMGWLGRFFLSVMPF